MNLCRLNMFTRHMEPPDERRERTRRAALLQYLKRVERVICGQKWRAQHRTSQEQYHEATADSNIMRRRRYSCLRPDSMCLK